MKQSKRIYLNAKQLIFMGLRQKIQVFVGGRGTGKTTVMGAKTFQYFQNMPKSKGAMVSLTYVQALTITLPPMVEFWSKCGLIEHKSAKEPGHFVVGKIPPPEWPRAWQPPQKYDNVVSFINGMCIVIVSMDRKDSGRGHNFDFALFDEAFLLDKDRIDKEIIPAIRGNIYRFDTHLHQTQVYVSSMPWLPGGMNMLNTFETQAKQHPDLVGFVEARTRDNIDVLGEAYLQNLKLMLPIMTYRVEVENERMSKLPNAFYPNFSERKHCYFDSIYYQDGLSLKDLLTDGKGIRYTDYDVEAPLLISMDFNAAFTSLIVGQELATPDGRIELRIINALYVKPEEVESQGKSVLAGLLEKLVNVYGQHKAEIHVYGDRNGNNKSAQAEETIYQYVERMLRLYGMRPVMQVGRRLDPGHQERFELISLLMEETDTSIPRLRINMNTCKDLIISMQRTPITPDFKKDKKSERQDIPQELATHLSDCFDNLVFPLYSHHLQSGFGGSIDFM